MAGARLAAVALLLTGCASGQKKDFEDWNPAIPVKHFKTVATVAGSDARVNITMMVQVREQLQKAGVNAVRRTGRWASIAAAVADICSSGAGDSVDGALFVSYDHLVLYDCQSGKAAFQIAGSPRTGGLGVTEMTKHLINYLGRGQSAPAP